MARLPASIPELVAQFGPHPTAHPGGWAPANPTARADALLLLRAAVRHTAQGEGRKVVGFEPWEEFPFNRGKLCPKGVKRYMQGEHPDRLRTPLARDDARGFAAH